MLHFYSHIYKEHLAKVTKLFSARFWVMLFRISYDKVIFLPILFPCMQRNEEAARRATENPPVNVATASQLSPGPPDLSRNTGLCLRGNGDGLEAELGNPKRSDIADDAERKMCLISGTAFFPRDVSISAQYQNKRERKKPARFHHLKTQTPQ